MKYATHFLNVHVSIRPCIISKAPPTSSSRPRHPSVRAWPRRPTTPPTTSRRRRHGRKIHNSNPTTRCWSTSRTAWWCSGRQRRTRPRIWRRRRPRLAALESQSSRLLHRSSSRQWRHLRRALWWRVPWAPLCSPRLFWIWACHRPDSCWPPICRRPALAPKRDRAWLRRRACRPQVRGVHFFGCKPMFNLLNGIMLF